MPARFSIALLAIIGCLRALPATADDSWPGYRGPTADGHSTAKNIATKWSEKENVRWKTAIHGRGWSSPVVLADQIWVTTSDEVAAPKPTTKPKRGDPPANPIKQVSFYAVCVDRETGKIVRDVKIATEQNPAYCHPFNTYASPTPFIEEGRLYVHFGSHGTWCIDTETGKTIWERRDLKCDHFRGPASSPVVYGDLLYLIFDGYDVQYVAALDKNTGKTVWKTDRKINFSTDNGDWKKAYATPAIFEIDGKQQLVCPSAECTIAYEPKTGAEIWRIRHGGMNGAARPVMGNGLLYLTAGHPKKLLAITPTGTGELSKKAIKWETNRSVPTRPSLLLDGEMLYMVSDDGFATCLDAATGKVIWNERLDGEFSGSPILAGGKIICCNQTGKTFVLAAGKTFSLDAVNRLGEDGDAMFMASPAVAGSDLILRTKTHLYAVGKP